MTDLPDLDLDKLSAPDRAFVESIADDEQRHVVVCSLVAHRRADRLAVGDPVPQLELRELGSDNTVGLSDCVDDRPLVLVFGSFT